MSENLTLEEEIILRWLSGNNGFGDLSEPKDTATASQLERRGFVKTRPALNSKIAINVTITDEGREALNTLGNGQPLPKLIESYRALQEASDNG